MKLETYIYNNMLIYVLLVCSLTFLLFPLDLPLSLTPMNYLDSSQSFTLNSLKCPHSPLCVGIVSLSVHVCMIGYCLSMTYLAGNPNFLSISL